MAPQPGKRIRIKAKEILQDIKAGNTSEAIRQKYGLSQASLQKVIGAFLQRQLVTLDDLRSVLVENVTQTKTVSAKAFLALFRESSDDFFLMEKLSINSNQLQQIYDTLIENGALSEYEYYSRERKAPELDDGSQIEAEDSTLVNLYEDKTSKLGDYVMAAKNSLEQDFVCSPPPVTSVASLNIGYSSPNSDKTANGSAQQCPNCGKPKALDFQETCFHCGILFSKFDKISETSGVSVWRDINARDIE